MESHLIQHTAGQEGKDNSNLAIGVPLNDTETKEKGNAVNSMATPTAVASMASELRQLVDTANAPIFGIDNDGLVNEWNLKTAEITGFPKEEAFKKPLVSTFIKQNLQQSVQTVLQNALRGQQTANYELEFQTKTKETRYLLVNATTKRDGQGNVIGVVGVAQDLTDDRRHTKELQEMHSVRASQEAKVETERNMTAYFAHELRNPLHAIDIALSVMPSVLDPAVRDLTESMTLCTQFMSSIMNNLLDVRKMEEGKMELRPEPTSITGNLKRLHGMLRPSIRRGVRFLYESNIADQDWALADAHRLQQIWTNVVTNAIKYTITGQIKLTVKWEDNVLCFECQDTGPGIPKDQQDAIFKRFVKRGGAPGTGLGLAIAKHLVDLGHGTIKFESDPSVRIGTKCVVRLPLEKCKPVLPITRTDTLEPIQDKLKVLVIDDVGMNRTMLRKRILRFIAPNAVVMEAVRGEEALEICSNPDNLFDIIIVDQYMEEAGGVLVGTEVVKEMREMGITSVLIGCSGNDIKEEFLSSGCDLCWGKPMPNNHVIVKQLRDALASKNIKSREGS